VDSTEIGKMPNLAQTLPELTTKSHSVGDDAGYEIVTLPLSQITERDVPADFIFADPKRLKIFGFQYKALYHNGDDHWPIDRNQHTTLTNYPWIFYCLSDLKSVTDHRLALDFARIAPVGAIRPPRVKPNEFFARGRGTGGYWRWGAFFQAFRACRVGARINTPADLRRLLGTEPRQGAGPLLDLMVDVFVTDLDRRRALHYSPPLR